MEQQQIRENRLDGSAEVDAGTAHELSVRFLSAKMGGPKVILIMVTSSIGQDTPMF